MLRKVSVVIPAKNEAMNLGLVFDDLDKAVAQLSDYRFEVILVDDNSTDGTRISFDFRVSSQAIGDKLTFKIGETPEQNWSGDVEWQRVSFDIPARRPLTMQWEYRKDASTAVGNDAAWIRRVVVE